MFLSSDPFVGFRQGFATVIQGIFGLILMFSLAATIVHVIQGERESAKKMITWMVAAVAGFILIEIMRYFNNDFNTKTIEFISFE